MFLQANFFRTIIFSIAAFSSIIYCQNDYPIIYFLSITLYWRAPPDDPQGIRVASVFELFFVWLSANFLIFLLLILLSVVLSPLLLARDPEYPQRIRVASVFEFCVCSLIACLFVSKFSHFSCLSACLSANFIIFGPRPRLSTED